MEQSIPEQLVTALKQATFQPTTADMRNALVGIKSRMPSGGLSDIFTYGMTALQPHKLMAQPTWLQRYSGSPHLTNALGTSINKYFFQRGGLASFFRKPK